MSMSVSSEGTDVLEAVRAAVDSSKADRVFGTPVVAEGVVLVPVARVAGGGGGGAGPAAEGGRAEGTGGGFGMSGRGLGVFVVKDGKVAWRPAVDVNRIVLGGQLVAITALLVLRAIV